MTKRCLNHAACLMKLQSCSWVTVLSINFHPQYGLLSYSEILCPHNPLTSTPTPPPSCAFSVLLCLWRVVLPFAGVPEEQRDANGGQSHYTKCSPVQLEKEEIGKGIGGQGKVKNSKTCISLSLSKNPSKK